MVAAAAVDSHMFVQLPGRFVLRSGRLAAAEAAHRRAAATAAATRRSAAVRGRPAAARRPAAAAAADHRPTKAALRSVTDHLSPAGMSTQFVFSTAVGMST